MCPSNTKQIQRCSVRLSWRNLKEERTFEEERKRSSDTRRCKVYNPDFIKAPWSGWILSLFIAQTLLYAGNRLTHSTRPTWFSSRTEPSLFTLIFDLNRRIDIVRSFVSGWKQSSWNISVNVAVIFSPLLPLSSSQFLVFRGDLLTRQQDFFFFFSTHATLLYIPAVPHVGSVPCGRWILNHSGGPEQDGSPENLPEIIDISCAGAPVVGSQTPGTHSQVFFVFVYGEKIEVVFFPKTPVSTCLLPLLSLSLLLALSLFHELLEAL